MADIQFIFYSPISQITNLHQRASQSAHVRHPCPNSRVRYLVAETKNKKSLNGLTVSIRFWWMSIFSLSLVVLWVHLLPAQSSFHSMQPGPPPCRFFEVWEANEVKLHPFFSPLLIWFLSFCTVLPSLIHPSSFSLDLGLLRRWLIKVTASRRWRGWKSCPTSKPPPPSRVPRPPVWRCALNKDREWVGGAPIMPPPPGSGGLVSSTVTSITSRRCSGSPISGCAGAF